MQKIAASCLHGPILGSTFHDSLPLKNRHRDVLLSCRPLHSLTTVVFYRSITNTSGALPLTELITVVYRGDKCTTPCAQFWQVNQHSEQYYHPQKSAGHVSIECFESRSRESPRKIGLSRSGTVTREVLSTGDRYTLTLTCIGGAFLTSISVQNACDTIFKATPILHKSGRAGRSLMRKLIHNFTVRSFALWPAYSCIPLLSNVRADSQLEGQLLQFTKLHGTACSFSAPGEACRRVVHSSRHPPLPGSHPSIRRSFGPHVILDLPSAF